VYRIKAEAQGIAGGGWYGHTHKMDTPEVKVTDSASEAEARAVEELSRADVERRLVMFHQWQHAMKLDEAATMRWAAEVRAERRAWRV